MICVACGPSPDFAPGLEQPSATESTGRALENEACFWGATPGGRVPLTKIIHSLESDDLGDRVEVRIVFNRSFVDLTYGENAIGWSGQNATKKKKKNGHSFKDLVGSDHTELVLIDGDGESAFRAKIDLISEDDRAPSGYASQGVTGGDGKIIEGDESHVVGFGSSLDDNFNALGHVLTESSPATDDVYAANDEFPDWNFAVEYRLAVSADAFGDAGFLEPRMEMVHASPSKLGENTVEVESGDCPDPGSDEDPFCPHGECIDPGSEGGDPDGSGEPGSGMGDPDGSNPDGSHPDGSGTGEPDPGSSSDDDDSNTDVSGL